MMMARSEWVYLAIYAIPGSLFDRWQIIMDSRTDRSAGQRQTHIETKLFDSPEIAPNLRDNEYLSSSNKLFQVTISV
jgi:hypothetical protein